MYQRILVPIDGSETSTRGLDEAIKLAKSLGSKICLFHVVDEHVLDTGYCIGTYAGEVIGSLRQTGQGIVRDAETLVRQQGVESETTVLESIGGRAAELIIKLATQWQADLIVMGTHGRRGLHRMAMGSDAESVVRDAPVPVLLIRGAGSTISSESKRQAPNEAVKQCVYA